MKFWLASLLTTTLIVPATESFAQPAERVQSPAAAACSALKDTENGVKWLALQDAPTNINSAVLIPAGGTHGAADNDLPEYCRVEGYVAANVGFLLRMPTKNWNGKFLFGGCGGPCGNYLEDRVDPALVRGYAVATTDMGHKGTGILYAYNNLQGQVDFAYRATHVATIASKELVAAYYGRRATWNYYFGCSTGGRQGMTIAQRFPYDFNGVVAGAPVFNHTANTPHFAHWNVRSNTDSNGKAILSRAQLPIIHQAVMAKCDALDGLKDGVLQDPGKCNFDPKTIVCKAGETADCLTPAQAETAIKFHTGARNSKGEYLYWGMPWGSEDQWTPWLNPNPQTGATTTSYYGFPESGGPTYKMTEYDYDRDPARLSMYTGLFGTLNPELSDFRKQGGKLILYHGHNDNNIPVGAAIDYYQKAVVANGGRVATDAFFRFFTPPAMNHCRDGAGGGAIDWLTAIENWVEKGQAPDRLIAYRPAKPYLSVPRALEDYGSPYARFDRFPLKPEEYDRARPLYPYPAIARYKGGDPKLPTSYVQAAH